MMSGNEGWGRGDACRSAGRPGAQRLPAHPRPSQHILLIYLKASNLLVCWITTPLEKPFEGKRVALKNALFSAARAL